MESPVIYWFRKDLRLDDLPGLRAAAATGRPVLACYVYDEQTPGDHATGAASRWWLHYSLQSLGEALTGRGGALLLRRGDTAQVLPRLAREVNAAAVYCSRCYEPRDSALEEKLHRGLGDDDIELKRYPGTLLFEPERVRTQAGDPYRVFTPFWRACLNADPPPQPQALPSTAAFVKDLPRGVALDDLDLRPRKPDWAAHWPELWQPGVRGASAALQRFVDGPLADYAEGRDHPQRAATSRLSPHLHFGEISPRGVWWTIRSLAGQDGAPRRQCEKFLSELGWREFAYHLLHHFPHIPEESFDDRFADFPWLGSKKSLEAWRRGRTGYPMVDAGMRELWHTGYMHNRVRMITASFLTKHLLIHWRRGEAWFRDTLVDADLANNVLGWQWVAGSGPDAAPYFRIFNPTLQGRKFDAQGEYIRRWVPELAGLPDKHLHEPAAAPDNVLREAGVTLGETYPEPIVDHREAREAALSAYGTVKNG